MIVSSAPDEVVRPLGEFLGVDDVIATRAEVDADGNYTGELAFYALRAVQGRRDAGDGGARGARPHGVVRLQRLDHRRPDARAVGHPVAVNPDRELARLARDEGWPALKFVRPVRLRDRFSVPPRPVLVVTGAMAAAGAGALVWWWLHRRERTPVPAPA